MSLHLYVSLHSPFACPSSILSENWVITSWLYWPKVNPAGSLRLLSPLPFSSSFFLPFVRPLHPHAPALHSSRIKYLQTVQGLQQRQQKPSLSCRSFSASLKRALTVRKCVRHHPGPCDDREKATVGLHGDRDWYLWHMSPLCQVVC